MKERMYINETEMTEALYIYEQYLQGKAGNFDKRLYSLLAVATQNDIKKLAFLFPLQVFAFLCYTWRVDPRSVFTRDPRFLTKRKLTQHELLARKELPLFTERFLAREPSSFIADKLKFER